jgi:hypothetical protein
MIIIRKLSWLKNIVLSPVFVAIIFFLLLQLQLFNLNIDFRDEGLLLTNAVKINIGEIPYRDFPLTTTPGSYYIQALFMQVFGNYVIIDRLIYIVCVVLTLILADKLFKLPLFGRYLYLILLSTLFIGERTFAFYNIEGLVLILASCLLFNKFKHTRSSICPFLIGVINSSLFVVKQSYGSVFLLIFLFLIAYEIKKFRVRNLLMYFTGILFILLPFFLYFYANGAFDRFIYYIFIFSKIVKNHRLPFVVTSLLFIPFFYFIINFARKISFKKIIWIIVLFTLFFVIYLLISPARILRLQIIYKDFLIYYYLLFLTIPVIVFSLCHKNKVGDKKQCVFLSIVALSMFLSSALSGRDYTTVVMVAPFYVPLVYYFIVHMDNNKLHNRNVIFLITLIIYVLPSITGLAKAYLVHYGLFNFKKETYLSSDIGEMKYIKILDKEKSDLDNLVYHIKTSTPKSEKILCFPYCPMINFLSERSTASYFNFFYPETFLAQDQARVIDDLKKSKETLILVQRNGAIENEANYEDNRLKILKQYILSHYKLQEATENFFVYGK